MPPRDSRALLSFMLEVLSDPDAPPALQREIDRYLNGPNGFGQVLRAMESSDESPEFHQLAARAEPIALARRAEEMLKAFASEMSPRTSLRQALAFVMVARGDLKFGYLKDPMPADKRRSYRQGYVLDDIKSRAGSDAGGKPILGSSLTNTTAALGHLIATTDHPDDDRFRPLALRPKGKALMDRIVSALRYPPQAERKA